MAKLQPIEAQRTTYTVIKCHPVGLLWSKYISLLADTELRGHILGKCNKIDPHYFKMSYLKCGLRFGQAPTIF
jgi:hypothetical protein